GREPVEQLGFVLTKRASEPLHRVQLRAHRARRPLAEESLRCPRRVVLPEVLEVLLEKKCAYRAQVAQEQLAKSPPLLVGEVLRALQEDPTGVDEHVVLALCPKATHLLAASLVYGLAHELHHVEAVEHVNRFAAALAHHLQERLPHVAGDELDAASALVPEHVEEAVEARSGPILRDVQQSLTSVVELVDQGEVAVAPLPRQLVDADRADVIEVAVLQSSCRAVS